jgi:hypothetical protein
MDHSALLHKRLAEEETQTAFLKEQLHDARKKMRRLEDVVKEANEMAFSLRSLTSPQKTLPPPSLTSLTNRHLSLPPPPPSAPSSSSSQSSLQKATEKKTGIDETKTSY